MAVEIGTGTGNVDLTSLLKGTDMGKKSSDTMDTAMYMEPTTMV